MHLFLCCFMWESSDSTKVSCSHSCEYCPNILVGLQMLMGRALKYVKSKGVRIDFFAILTQR